MPADDVGAAVPDPARPLDIRVLGPVSVTVRGAIVSLRSPRRQRLLALLALNRNGIVAFEHIVDVLWDDPPETARQQVYNVVSTLRHILARAGSAATIEAIGTGYRLADPEDAVDFARFQAALAAAAGAEAAADPALAAALLERALREWQGLPLAGLTGSFFETASMSLSEARLDAVERLTAAAIRLGEPSHLIGLLLELVAQFPFRETLRAALIRALHRCGRQADALACFEEGRRLLAEELGVDPGRALRDAYQDVLQDHAAGAPARRAAEPKELDEPREPQEPKPDESARPARSYLPRDIPEFSGRTQELASLIGRSRAQRAHALVISAINGMGGVGKTTLAVHLAHQLADEYPDGHYFIDLQGFTPTFEPLTPAQALAQLLRQCGIAPELIPPDVESRSALWRARIARSRALILLDNALNEAQVRPLLPGSADCLVLVSSRRRMPALEGSVPLSLDVLAEDEAVELFLKVLGPERAADIDEESLRAVVRLCGRLPLALHVAAARMRDRPAWTMAQVAGQLADERVRARFLATGDRDVMGVLSWSYRHLTADQQRLFRLLAIHPGPHFDAHLAAALVECAVDEAEIRLEELVDANLLEQRVFGRYHFHDLVRDCARGLMERHSSDAEQAAARDRLLGYYLWSVSRWSEALNKKFYRIKPTFGHEPPAVRAAAVPEAAMAAIDRDLRNLVAVIEFARQIGQFALEWQLVCSLLGYFGRNNFGDEAEDLLRCAAEGARGVGSLEGEALALMGLAYALQARGSVAEARRLMRRSAELSEQAGDDERLLYQRLGLGIMFVTDGLYEESVRAFTDALALARRLGDLFAQASLVINLGVVRLETGDLAQALEHFKAAEASGVFPPDSTEGAQLAANIGRVHLFREEYTEASAWFGRALTATATHHDNRAHVSAMIGQSAAERALGRHASALELGRQALEIAQGSGNIEAECDAYLVLADILVSGGDPDTAENVLVHGNTAVTRASQPRYVARVDELRAHIALARGDRAEARRAFTRALEPRGGVAYRGAVERHLADERGTAARCWHCGFAESE